MKNIDRIIQISVLAIVSLAGCVTTDAVQMPVGSNEHARLDDYCKGISNSFECAQAIERIQLPKYSEFVQRKGDTLAIRLKNGQKLNIKNRGKFGDLDDRVQLYSFRDYFQKQGILVIEIHYWEGGEYLLVNTATGQQSKVIDIGDVFPVPSRSLVY
ncbi:MAG: hypothetical protein VBE63_19295 [Lamprobacter sp.]|uniref:hypothetical protein n=1 Tax=Lamprobacter sp. TaxID=3100796 RepID=UPI002B25AD15|nr:hypothetical protein [Lamprobacter sp.]MEA3642063.1 hypothetical protein [Lamprobacter sp.]